MPDGAAGRLGVASRSLEGKLRSAMGDLDVQAYDDLVTVECPTRQDLFRAIRRLPEDLLDRADFAGGDARGYTLHVRP